MKKLLFLGLFALVSISIIAAEPAFAGPGGKIATAAFETFWGKLLLITLTIIFLPLIIYRILQEKLAERRSRSDLGFMANHSATFEWLQIQARAKECFYKVHSGWKAEDLSTTSSWMTDWYWQHQQQAHLEKWKNEGLVNICEIKKIVTIRPLLFSHKNNGCEHENSMVVIAITAKMNDYLQHRESKKIIEGSKKIKPIETIWTFKLDEGIWKVSDIEEGSMSLAYARAIKYLPKIENTIISDLRA